MYTPSHAVLNLAVLSRAGGLARSLAALAGAVLPDVPNLVLFLLYGPQAWRLPAWHLVCAPTHSAPFALALLAVGAWRRARSLAVLAASWLLHLAGDFLVHGRDAHPHLFPLSDWRFRSPISYWDRGHHAQIVAVLEMSAVLACSAVLWRRHPSRPARAALILVCAGLFAGYVSGVAFWGT